MPTYEYLCEACEHRFEEFQSITARARRKCPCCGKSALRRLIGTGAGVIFKGSGFYQTDYRSESYRQAAKKESPAEAAKAEGDNKAKGDGKAKGKSGSEGAKPSAKEGAD